jgi:hypothetical protein
MSESLAGALERWRNAGSRRKPAYAPLTAQQVESLEESFGRPIASAWRRTLLEAGWGPDVGYRWSSGVLRLRPTDAVEHQVETDTGQAIAAGGRTVIGYVHGIGECIAVDGEGDDPRIWRVAPGGSAEPAGTLSSFLTELARRLEEASELMITELIEPVAASKELLSKPKWGQNEVSCSSADGSVLTAMLSHDELQMLIDVTGRAPVAR